MRSYYVISEHVVKAQQGLLPEKAWGTVLSGCDTRLIRWLRNELDRRVESLTEKFNCRQRGQYYFGYCKGRPPDRLYIYVQVRKLVLDVRLDSKRAQQLRSIGFDISLRQNWQGRVGWLTGWNIPYEVGWEKRQPILEVLLEAF